MQSNLELLVAELRRHTAKAHTVKKYVEDLARDASEMQAMAEAVSEEVRLHGTHNAVPIPLQQCRYQYAHKAHLWRDEDYSKAVWATCRCEGRSTDMT